MFNKKFRVVAYSGVLSVTMMVSACGLSDDDVRNVPRSEPKPTATTTEGGYANPTANATETVLPKPSYTTVQTPAPTKKAAPKPKKKAAPPVMPKNELSKEKLPKDTNPEFYKLFYQSLKNPGPAPQWLSADYILRFVRAGDGINIYTTFDPKKPEAKILAEDMCAKANTFGVYENIPSLVGETTVFDGEREEFVVCN